MTWPAEDDPPLWVGIFSVTRLHRVRPGNEHRVPHGQHHHEWLPLADCGAVCCLTYHPEGRDWCHACWPGGRKAEP